MLCDYVQAVCAIVLMTLRKIGVWLSQPTTRPPHIIALRLLFVAIANSEY